MNQKERIEAALNGRKPDIVPVMPIYDFGYVMRSIGRDPREFITANSEQCINYIEENFLRHKVDGLLVFSGCNDEWTDSHNVEKFCNYWLVTEKKTGKKYSLLPDGSKGNENGRIIQTNSSINDISNINSREDLKKLVPEIPTCESIEKSGFFRPLKNLSAKYPECHFTFQVPTPMSRVINLCGGYIQGLTTLATKRDLYREMLSLYVPIICATISPGKKAGGKSILLTSYYTGADTISPKDYTDLIYPVEKKICEKAHQEGLYVLYWFLGELMPILEKVKELPLDALVLEQGRKGYDIDPVEIRKRVGKNFCLFGFGYERDYCTFNKDGLETELKRQLYGAALDGSFIAGTPIMPPDADPDAVDYYFKRARSIISYN